MSIHGSITCPTTRYLGFSLIELMVVVVIIEALFVAGNPHLSLLNDRQQRNTTVNSLFRDLAFARTQALYLGVRVYLCPGSYWDRCAQTKQWESGWFTFADYNKDRKPNQNEILFYRNKLASAKIKIRFRSPNYLFFKKDGSAWPNGHFTVCLNSDRGTPLAIIVYFSGRSRVSERAPDGRPINCL